jgi:regulator of sigma E protease
MTILFFLIILGILVFVHELGHFLVAKKAGVEVEEFGFGYPPRALKIGKKWGTLFTLNWIPFGGFVKIFGENYEEVPPLAPPPRGGEQGEEIIISQETYSVKSTSQGIFQSFESENLELSISDPEKIKNLSFTQVSKKWQAGILVAGVTFNILFAWFLFSLGFMIGLPTSVENEFNAPVKNPALTIIGLAPDSPAQKAGLKAGDKLKEISLPNGEILKELNPENVSNFINKSSGEIVVAIDRGGKNFDFKLTPETGIEKDRKVIGISMDMVGTLSLPIHKAFYEGGRTTLRLSYLTVKGIVGLIGGAAMGKADISQVAGPVGIVGLVGDATQLGFAYLLTFTALISINLAIINLVPFPALDGGRILFVAIEGITKKKINPKFAGTLNTVGFFILIALMLIVTYRDILRLF